MNQYIITFRASLIGSIGTRSTYQDKVYATDIWQARTLLYSKFEHVTVLLIRKVEQ